MTEAFLSHFRGVRPAGKDKWVAFCPAHKAGQEKRPSLNFTLTKDRWLVHCQADCTIEAVLKAVGLEESDLFTDAQPITKLPSRIVAVYNYTDANGKPFEVVRTDPKGFYQRQPDGKGGYINNLDGITPTLYHQDRLAEAQGEMPIWNVEGEKDCDRLWNEGLASTTNPMGAGKWRWSYSESLKGEDLIIIPDNDEVGRKHAEAVAQSCLGKAKRIRILSLPAKDVSDWLDLGGTIDELQRLAEKAPDYNPSIVTPVLAEQSQYVLDDETIRYCLTRIDKTVVFEATDVHRERTGIHGRISIGIGDTNLAWSVFNIEKDEERTRLANSAWRRLNDEDGKSYSKEAIKLDLDEFCRGLWQAHVSSTMPEPTSGDDIPFSFLLEPFIIEGGGTILYAPPGAGKSYTALAIGVSIDAGTNNLWHVQQTPTAFINLERSAQSVRNRLGAVNVALGLPRSRPLVILNARGHSLSDLVDSIKEATRKYHIGFLVLDSISRGGFGDLNDNQPVNRAIDTLNLLCPTWLALGHTPRSDESHIFGGVHHEAGADIMVELTRQQEAEENKLGIALEITKANDVGVRPKIKLAMEFGERGLTAIRRADAHEFVKLDMKRKPDMKDALMDYLLDIGEATASQLAKELGYNRVNISKMLRNDNAFVETKRDRQNVYYGVKAL